MEPEEQNRRPVRSLLQQRFEMQPQPVMVLQFFLLLLSGLASGSVTYDRKAIIINGQRRILLSGSIHYPRSLPEVGLFDFAFPIINVGLKSICFPFIQMWPDLIQKAKDGGLDVIQTYVFWNGHEPSPGQVP